MKLYDFFSQARRTCGATHLIRPCTILHTTGFGLPPNFENCLYSASPPTCKNRAGHTTNVTLSPLLANSLVNAFIIHCVLN